MRSQFRTRRGFTVIELLVMLVIIYVTIGMVVPAWQRMRDVGQRMEMSGNIKQLGLAIINYGDFAEVTLGLTVQSAVDVLERQNINVADFALLVDEIGMRISENEQMLEWLEETKRNLPPGNERDAQLLDEAIAAEKSLILELQTLQRQLQVAELLQGR